MAKIKLPTKSPNIDMTPMVDLFSLLLTFFMLTTSFRPQEAVIVDSPNSISEKQAPDKNLLTISIGDDNKIYFNVDNGPDSSTHFRKKILEQIAYQYKLKFTPHQLKRFEQLSSFGFPIKYLPTWIDLENQTARDALQEEIKKRNEAGIPMDSADNQLASWVHFTRLINPRVEVAIKGD
ncbi:MAG: biopolymer transporter ExbD, partial [Bacteroidia bacterium]|nr:biopolymer transporter ExbD [Bacteroidia bacterium]